jgi:hypothetical protein
MHGYMALVEEFHNKLEVSAKEDVPTDHLLGLELIGTGLIQTSQNLLKYIKLDIRFLRSHLITEELGEFFIAYSKGDIKGMLDALADLQYVLSGTIVTHSLERLFTQAFLEVHASNMTKEKQESDQHKDRIRDKGPNYMPPDMDAVIAGRTLHVPPELDLTGLTPEQMRLMRAIRNGLTYEASVTEHVEQKLLELDRDINSMMDDLNS